MKNKDVYIVMGDYGYYMERDVEIVRVFGMKDLALNFAKFYEKQKQKKGAISYYCWVETRKVYFKK